MWLAILASIAAAIARLVLIFRLDLIVDEALYYWIGQRTALTLAPHPPGVPLLARAMTGLFGRTEWAVRLPSFLMMAALPWIVFLLLRRMGAGRLAWWSIFVLNAIPLYVGFGAVLTPDAPQIFIWSSLLLLSYNALEKPSVSRWGLVGAVFGIGMAFKYILALFVPSLLLCMLLVPSWRRQLASAGPYIAAVVTIAMLAILVSIAGIESARDALRYHLQERQHWSEALDPANIGIFQLAHLAYISPVLYVIAIISMFRCGWQGWRLRDRRLLFAFSFSIVMFLFFAIVSALTGRRLTREHWDAPAYVSALAGGILLLRGGSSILHRSFVSGVSLGMLITGIIIIEATTGAMSSMAALKPPFSSFRGWRQFSACIDEQFRTFPSGPKILLTRNFHSLVEYAFYGGETRELYKLDHKLDPKWGLTGEWRRAGVTWRDLESKPFKTLLFVREDPRVGPPENAHNRSDDEWLQWLSAAFNSATELPSFDVTENNYVFRRYRVYRGDGLKDIHQFSSPPDTR